MPQRDLRDLTRHRTTLVREKAAVVNRLQKVLEWANVKLASVLTDVMGVSTRKMLSAIVKGQDDAGALAQLAVGSLRRKQSQLEQALRGRVRDHHRFLIASHLSHIDFLDEQIASFDTQIETHISAQVPLEPIPPLGEAGQETPPDSLVLTNHPAPLTWEQAVVLLVSFRG